MSKTMDWLDEIARKREHEEKIWCPHCGTIYELCDDRWEEHVTYWGSNGSNNGMPAEVECDECGKTFWVTEWVERTYGTSTKNELAYENEGKARLEGE